MSNQNTSPSALDCTDPFIGVDGPGCTLCGPYHPLGLVRLGPDTVAPHKTNGYQSDLPIQGFSHTHVSGTGGQGRFGNVSITPFIGDPGFAPVSYNRIGESAIIGRYSVELDPGNIQVRLTCSARCGVCSFTFLEPHAANILIDASAVHKNHFELPATCESSAIEWTGPATFSGYGTFRGGWGHDYPYQIFFYGELNKVPDKILCASQNKFEMARSVTGCTSRSVAHWNSVDTVEVRTGISFVSTANARASLEGEVQGKTFAEIERSNRAAWQSWFDRVTVEGGTKKQRTIFHTFLTRLLCMPTDLGIDDEFAGWKSGVRHFSEYYCLWDSVRNANSLISLFAPELERDMLNCLLDIADKTGWLPDAWITGHSAQIQGGSSADILFNEAYLKGIEDIDYEKALSYMRKNNEVESPDPHQFGRYLADYRDLGYVSTRAINCVSRHLEYTYQDWCIGSLSERLGDNETARTFYQSADKLWNLWRDDLQHFAPKTPEGDWAHPFDINVCRPDSWNDPYFYEGVSRAWSYNTQHDFAGLVARCGGPAGFEKHLDQFFLDGYRITKETFMHVPFLYHYADRPDKSSSTIRNILEKAYGLGRNGIPDNEDMGCHSALYICGLLGLYPMMGQDWYFLTAPAFVSSEIQLGLSGKSLQIKAPGASETHIYIIAATLDGEPLDRAWIRHQEIANGAVLKLDLAETPNSWGRGAPPPSPMEYARCMK